MACATVQWLFLAQPPSSLHRLPFICSSSRSTMSPTAASVPLFEAELLLECKNVLGEGEPGRVMLLPVEV
jgi:hypothetical protein